MKTEPTFTATIYVGRKGGYTGPIISRADVLQHIQRHVDTVGLCVTVTDTTFVYSDGQEPGYIIGLINYPRFPAQPPAIRARALALAHSLHRLCLQHRVSVVCSDKTHMIEPEDIAQC